MKKIDITAGSSEPLVPGSPEYQAWLETVRQDHLRRQAKDAARGARGNAAKIAKAKAGVAQAIDDHRAGVARMPPSGRVSFVLKRIQASPERYGLKVKPDGSIRCPDRDTVAKVLNQLGFPTGNANT